MKFRALLIDPAGGHERPQQALTNSIDECRRWAAIMLSKAKSPDACVNIYQSIEQQVEMIPKPKPAAPAAEKEPAA